MIFQYEAVNNHGTIVSGELEATSASEATRALRVRNLIATQVQAADRDLRPSAGKKASRQELLVSLHEMVTLLESGVSIGETIESQSHANYPDDLSRSYNLMATEIRKGNSFANALRKSGLKLPIYLYYLAEAGEMTGNLAQSLREGVQQFEYEHQLAQEFRTALTYPSVLVASGIAAVILIFVFVVPKFLPMLDRAEDLPWLSAVIFTTGAFFNEHYLMLLSFVALLALVIGWAATNKAVRQKVFDVIAVTPIVGMWIAEMDTARWSSVMAALLASRADLLSSLDLALDAIKTTRRKARMELVSRDVRAGESLADSLEKSDVLTTTGYNLIRSGEKTGKLAPMMKSVARVYDEAARTRMRRVLTLIEPLAILILGGVIGSIIVGVILGITSINEVGF